MSGDVRPATGSAALAGVPASPRVAGVRSSLERLALVGVFVHAIFLPISIAGMQIGLGVALGALVALRVVGRRVWARSALDLPCILLPAAAIVSLALGALAGSSPVGWHEATLWRSILTPILVVSALEVVGPGAGGDRAGLERVALWALAAWAVAALVPSVIAWIQFWNGFDPLHALGLRSDVVRGRIPVYREHYAAVGFFRWYQRLAHNLIPPICITAAVALYGRAPSRIRVVLAVGAAAAAVAVVFTLSRAAWVSLVAAAITLVSLGGRARWRSIAIILVASSAMALHPGVQTRLRHLTERGNNDDRKGIWTVCRAVIEDYPLTGVGWGNLPRRSLPYYVKYPTTGEMRAWCHDSFLSAWAEGGPVLFAALVAYWALLLRGFARAVRGANPMQRAASAGAIAALVAMLMNSLAHDILYSSEAMYGLGFALGIAGVLARLTNRGAVPDPR